MENETASHKKEHREARIDDDSREPGRHTHRSGIPGTGNERPANPGLPH